VSHSLSHPLRFRDPQVSLLAGTRRARDPKLNRDIALKVLQHSVADDPDRLARLRREGQVLASLNHRHIAQIHGFEDSGVTHALVMELFEGPPSRAAAHVEALISVPTS
jgi:serine/threonine protein kinase